MKFPELFLGLLQGYVAIAIFHVGFIGLNLAIQRFQGKDLLKSDSIFNRSPIVKGFVWPSIYIRWLKKLAAKAK